MIYIIYSEKVKEAGDLVYLAFARSFSRAQIKRLDSFKCSQDIKSAEFLVLVEPDDVAIKTLNQLYSQNTRIKILLLGKLPSLLAKKFNVKTFSFSEDILSDANCDPASIYSFQESRLRIGYRKPLGSLTSPIEDRPFLRYDFRNEWNNLNYGAIRMDDSIWSLSMGADVPKANLLAEVVDIQHAISAYAALFEDESSSMLWFNRAVGPIDSQEWRLVEYFFASYRHTELPSAPVLSEIPYGFDAFVTMRLDCDEEIKSARPLFENYCAWQVPFSLAIHTSLLSDSRHEKMIHEVLAHQGAILSHSDTHAPHWGGNYENAYQEAHRSAVKLNSIVKNPVHYAVSPFHHTPHFVPKALMDADYFGFVGGTISSNPEVLMARGGIVQENFPHFIGHSQSCMLHGECLLLDENPIRIYKEAFLIAKRGRALFGFLDHPFSSRYTYGWQSESARIEIHRQLIEYIRARGHVLFANEEDALNFIRYKSSVKLNLTPNKKIAYTLPSLTARYELTVEFCDELIRLTKEGVPA